MGRLSHRQIVINFLSNALKPRVNAERRAGVEPTTSARQDSVLTDAAAAPARGAVDRQFSALGVRSETDPGDNYGDVADADAEDDVGVDSRFGVERPDPAGDPDPHPREKGAGSSE